MITRDELARRIVERILGGDCLGASKWREIYPDAYIALTRYCDDIGVCVETTLRASGWGPLP